LEKNVIADDFQKSSIADIFSLVKDDCYVDSSNSGG
jgi:hypothetical protein